MGLNNLNLLQAALGIIPKQYFKYFKYLGNTVNDFGISVPEYADCIEVYGSIQPVKLALYETFGLNMEQNYRLVFASIDICGNEKQPQPDRFMFENSVWEVIKNSPWYEYNGWNGVLAVEIKELRE